jgi:PhoPQ-activated pathogenicity-related protein
MPKFLINATGDQFFVPDSSQFYFDELPGVKYLRYVPNADHSLDGTDAWETLLTCYHAVLTRAPLPQFSWKIPRPETLEVRWQTVPSHVKLWQATNPEKRDFRLDSIGKVWTSTDLPITKDGVCVATVASPETGWRAFLLELTFPNEKISVPFKFTTPVSVVPDREPFRYVAPTKHPKTGAPR